MTTNEMLQNYAERDVVWLARKWAEAAERDPPPSGEFLAADLEAIARHIERLQIALRTFCTSDWYSTGHGTFTATVEKAALDEAKDVLGMVPQRN